MGEDRPEGDEVRVDAAVGLDVGVLGAEERLRQLDGARFDGVDVVAAGVEAVAGRALGVLIAEPVAHREEDGGRGEVLAGDELEVRTLVGELLPDAVGDLGEGCADDVEGGAEGDGFGRGCRGSGGGWLRFHGPSPRLRTRDSGLVPRRAAVVRVASRWSIPPRGASRDGTIVADVVRAWGGRIGAD